MPPSSLSHKKKTASIGVMKHGNNISPSITSSTSHERPGTLIVFEGFDGSGKSTQVHILKNLLEANGFFVHVSNWNSSPHVKPLTKALKKNNKHLPSSVFDMVHAADMMDRYIQNIQTKLAAGMIVICDRYIYTAIARGVARGLPQEKLVAMNQVLLPEPDLTCYFRMPVEIALERCKTGKIKWYEAGLDQGLSDNTYESFLMFQGKIGEVYDDLLLNTGTNTLVVNAADPVYKTTPHVRSAIEHFIQEKYDVSLR